MAHKWLALLIAALAFASALSFSLAAEFTAPFSNDKRWEQARKDLAQGKAAEAKAAFEELLKAISQRRRLASVLGHVAIAAARPPGGDLVD